MDYTARIPTDLAAELQASGLAHPIPQVRSAGPFLADLIIAINSASTIVILLGTPIGTKSISERIVHWLQNREDGVGVKLTMNARSRHGRVELELDDATKATNVASIISDVIETLDAG